MKPNNLKKIRSEKGLTLWGITATTGISTTTLGAIENHGYVPIQKRQEKLADALGVTRDDIWPVTSDPVEVASV